MAHRMSTTECCFTKAVAMLMTAAARITNARQATGASFFLAQVEAMPT